MRSFRETRSIFKLFHICYTFFMNKYLKRLPVLLAGAGSALYLILIFNNNLWMDEAFTACLVRGSFREMLDRSFSDTLPPLYNLTAWCMTQVFGYNSVILKLTSVLPMVLLMFFSAFKLPSLFRESTASLFILCLITAPHMVHYGVEIRMYSMAMAFATIAAIFACECTVKTGFGPWLQFSVFTALAGYTHHFGLIADAFVWLALFISILAVKRHLLLSWLKAAGLTADSAADPRCLLLLFRLGSHPEEFSVFLPLSVCNKCHRFICLSSSAGFDLSGDRLFQMGGSLFHSGLCSGSCSFLSFHAPDRNELFLRQIPIPVSGYAVAWLFRLHHLSGRKDSAPFQAVPAVRQYYSSRRCRMCNLFRPVQGGIRTGSRSDALVL